MIATLAATLITYQINVTHVAAVKRAELLDAIRNIYIGSSKQWIDEKLGSPTFIEEREINDESGIKPDTVMGNGEKLLECMYVFETVSVRIYYDSPENSCKAFFVTKMETNSEDTIRMPEFYSWIVQNKPLGEFVFTEIDSEPEKVYGYTSNGVGYTFYGEQYYFAGRGGYHNFYFLMLDYGALDSLRRFMELLLAVQNDIAPLKNFSNYHWPYNESDILVQRRSEMYPNTYGISTLGMEMTFDLISFYGGFDTLQLRGRDG